MQWHGGACVTARAGGHFTFDELTRQQPGRYCHRSLRGGDATGPGILNCQRRKRGAAVRLSDVTRVGDELEHLHMVGYRHLQLAWRWSRRATVAPISVRQGSGEQRITR